jgi:hypothetical protein
LPFEINPLGSFKLFATLNYIISIKSAAKIRVEHGKVGQKGNKTCFLKDDKISKLNLPQHDFKLNSP